ncbi:HET-domain-containing protein, partial [Setomelanomma holmii]
DTFQYERLDTTRQQIRLVRLHPADAQEHTHVFCDIHTFDLANAPPYIALSYTWGAPDPKLIIFVGDEPHEVRENLYDFLYTFRSEGSNSNYIYIDQLCIDQNSPDERNHQVRLMSKIYRGCICVLVWLDQSSAKAAKDFQDAPQLDSAEQILRNPYFTRLWIVQEVLLAPEAIVFCGGVWLSWDALGELIWKMPDWYLSIQRPHDTASMAWLFKSTRGTLWEQDYIPLDRCINLFSCMQCADLRDKVYGLLRLSVHQVLLDAITVLRSIHWRTS